MFVAKKWHQPVARRLAVISMGDYDFVCHHWPIPPDHVRRVQFQQVTTDRQLDELCVQLSSATVIAFDTEFVSEDSYRPELCLIQVEAEGLRAVVDPFAVTNLTPFWNALADGTHQTVVHAGREEFLFSLRTIDRRPHNWFDVQLAAGLVGMEYPSSYGNLVSRVLSQKIPKGETRTDWRRRPLSELQLEYALNDVLYLREIRDRLHAQLEELGRTDWLAAESADWQKQLEEAEQSERWRRISGISGLSRRSLAIAREIWRWREQEAESRDIPPRRVLRDDLIVELARRRSADIKQLRAVRGMSRNDLRQKLPALSKRISAAKNLSDSELPEAVRTSHSNQLNLTSQFMLTALSSICRSRRIAPSLVGTAQDVRDFISYRLGRSSHDSPTQVPALAQGWRGELVGNLLDELLTGRLSIRVTDPLSDSPLVFEE